MDEMDKELRERKALEERIFQYHLDRRMPVIPRESVHITQPVRGLTGSVVYAGTYDGQEIIFKPDLIWNSIPKHLFDDVIKREANIMYRDLPNVPHTVAFHGWVEGDLIKDHRVAHNRECVGGIVMERAKGKPLTQDERYINSRVYRSYAHHTGINLLARVAEQVAAYHEGCIEQRYIDMDAHALDVFLDEESVTKVDYNGLELCSDREAGWDIEVVPHKFENAMIDLLIMTAITAGFTFSTSDSRFNEFRKSLGDVADVLDPACSTLHSLIDAYQEGTFHAMGEHSPKVYHHHPAEWLPDKDAFLAFLNQWVTAMKEYGEVSAR